MGAELAFTFFDKILDVFNLVRNAKQAKKAERKTALAALVAAIQLTQRYIAERERGAARDQNREFDISDSWRQASMAVAEIDLELGRVCWDKGGYWMNPDIWTDEMIEAKGIAIKSLEAKVPELIGISEA